MIIEITDEQMKNVSDGGKHCELMRAGWAYSENEDGTQGFYSYPGGFDASGLCLDDAWKINRMIQSWGEEL